MSVKTKEEWQQELDVAKAELNSIVENARADGHTVNLSVICKEPLTMVSLVKVEIP